MATLEEADDGADLLGAQGAVDGAMILLLLCLMRGVRGQGRRSALEDLGLVL